MPRIITRQRLDEAAEKYPDAKANIQHWYRVTRAATWSNLVETRKTFPHADQVKVASKRTVTVFNLTNSYRLITAIHYNRHMVFILRVLTHADYDKGQWKQNL